MDNSLVSGRWRWASHDFLLCQIRACLKLSCDACLLAVRGELSLAGLSLLRVVEWELVWVSCRWILCWRKAWYLGLCLFRFFLFVRVANEVYRRHFIHRAFSIDGDWASATHLSWGRACLFSLLISHYKHGVLCRRWNNLRLFNDLVMRIRQRA